MASGTLVSRVLGFARAIMLTSLLATALAGYLASTTLAGFRFEVPELGQSFGPIDTIFGAAGLLAILGGLYTALALRGVRLPAKTEETATREGAALPAGSPEPAVARP